MMRLGELLRDAAEKLERNAGLEAQLLLAFAVNMERALLLAHLNDEASEEIQQHFAKLLERRLAGEPLQYLLGKANFMGFDFSVRPGVLIPRFDTELLVQRALDLLENMTLPPKVLDVCTGSGAIAVSLSVLRPECEVWASDLSEQALEIAKENNTALGGKVRFFQGDLLQPLQHSGERFSMILSNPPYITTEELLCLDKEVREYEPRMALWGGADGLDFYRRLVWNAKEYLYAGGYLLMEIGYLQGDALCELLQQAGWEAICLHKDWQGHDRVVEAKKR